MPETGQTRSGVEEIKTLLEQILEGLHAQNDLALQSHTLIHEIATNLDTLTYWARLQEEDRQAENLRAVHDEIYHSLPFWRRARVRWQRAKYVADLTEAEGQAYQD